MIVNEIIPFAEFEKKGIHIIITAVVEVYLKFMHQRYMISRCLKMK